MKIICLCFFLLFVKLNEARVVFPVERKTHPECSFQILASKNNQLELPQNIAVLQMINFSFQKGNCYSVAYKSMNLSNAIEIYQEINLSKAKIPLIEVHLKDEAVGNNFLMWLKENIKIGTIVYSPKGTGELQRVL